MCNTWFSDFNTLTVSHSETRTQNTNDTQYLTRSETVFCNSVHQCITLRLEIFDTFTRSNLEIQDEGNVALCRAYSRVWVPQSVGQRFGLLRGKLSSTDKSLYVVGAIRQKEDLINLRFLKTWNISTRVRNSKTAAVTLDMEEKKVKRLQITEHLKHIKLMKHTKLGEYIDLLSWICFKKPIIQLVELYQIKQHVKRITQRLWKKKFNDWNLSKCWIFFTSFKVSKLCKLNDVQQST